MNAARWMVFAPQLASMIAVCGCSTTPPLEPPEPFGSADAGLLVVDALGPEDGGAVGADANCPYAAMPFEPTQSDPHNCGSTGNDCDGGACDDGACVALPAGVLATGQMLPIALVADEVSVYWLNWGNTLVLGHGPGLPPTMTGGAQVLKCAVGGCNNEPTVLASIPGSGGGLPVIQSALALDANSVYWTTQSTIESCAIGGCGCTPTMIASSLIQPPGVAVGGDRVYWTLWGSGQVETCPIAGCDGAPTLLAGPLGAPSSVAADPSTVYWVDGSGIWSAAVSNLGAGDAGPTELWSSPYGAQGVAVDSTNVYWLGYDGDGGTIMQCSKADCIDTAVTLAAGQADPSAIAVDSDYVYWRDDNVYKCAIGGCSESPTLVATADYEFFDSPIAVNSKYIFWTQQGASEQDIQIHVAPK